LGHVAIIWGVMLAECALLWASQLILHGQAFAVSRAGYSVPWAGDVRTGQPLVSSTRSVLRANPVFQVGPTLAKLELTRSPAPDSALGLAEQAVWSW
jgi:hypothetical protein